jgi:uroporphyrinogen decarboxylase
MKPKKRLLTTISHKELDRISIDLGATPSTGISVVDWQNLLKYLGKEHLQTWVYDVVQEMVQPEMEILVQFGIDVLDVGLNFNQVLGYWHKFELSKGYPGSYPKWFQPQLQKDGLWLAFNDLGEPIGRMPMGATFFD